MKQTKLKLMTIIALSLSLAACGGDEPMTDAQFMRKQQEQQLAADREAQRIQNDIAREHLRAQQIQTQAMQQSMMPQYGQPGYVQPGTAQVPVQQVVDDGVGLGTVMAGAAAAGAVGYMAGKNNGAATSNNSYYSSQQARAVQQVRPVQRPVVKPAAKPIIKQPTTAFKRPLAPAYKPTASARPTVKRYSSSPTTTKRRY